MYLMKQSTIKTTTALLLAAMIFGATAGAQSYAASNGGWSSVVSMDDDTSPTITVQPADVTGNLGDIISMEVKAKGESPTYQWQLSDDKGANWRNSSVKTSVYSTTLSDKNNGRCVRCIVTDKNGHTVVSDTAYMKLSPLTILQQPDDFTGVVGNIARMSVKATGAGLSYQWQLSDDQGGTWRNSSTQSAVYATVLGQKHNGRCLRCMITDRYGNTVTSDPAIMRVSSLAITSQPKNCTVAIGKTVWFAVKAAGEGLTYQWQLSDNFGKNWRNSSVKTARYETILSEKNNGRTVRCIVTDSYGAEAISANACMKRSDPSPLSIVTQPENCLTTINGKVYFSVCANGDDLTYQWQLSDDGGTNWRNSSVKTSTYQTTLTPKNNGRAVRCIITDTYGNVVISDTAVMVSC